MSADPKAGDGVGILTQIPHQFFQKELSALNIILPRPDDYAVGMFFLPRNEEEKTHCKDVVSKYFRKFGLKILVQRKVPTNENVLGIQSKVKNLLFINFLYQKLISLNP